MSKSTTVIVRTEVWATRQGSAVKAAVRKSNGQFLGATNQTSAVVVVGAK